MPRGKGLQPGEGEAWGRGSLGKGKPGAHPTLAVGLGVSISALSTQGAISERLTFPCPFCEAAFTSKTQLEKHRIWNHMDRSLPAPKPGPVSRPVTVSRPVGVSKPIGVSKPVTISKPIGISKPVTVVAGPQATQPQQQGAHSPHSGYP